MAEPEAVRMSFACGPGMCDMDVGKTGEGSRIFAGGAEGMLKVRERERGNGDLGRAGATELFGFLSLYPCSLFMHACI